MSRNKSSRLPARAAAALLIAGALPLMGSALIDPAKLDAGSADYVTAQAKYGTITRDMSETAVVYQPTIVDIRCEVRNARVAEVSVTRANVIEEGTKLGVLRSESSRADLAETTITLERARESYEKGVQDREEAIREKQLSAQNITDPAEREIARLEMQRMQIELDDYCLRQERSIELLEKREAEQTEALEDAVLYAPVTGSIAHYSYLSPGDSVAYDSVILSLRTDDPTLIRIEDPDGRWRYGMDVTINYGTRMHPKSAKARIVSADNVLSPTERRGFAYAQLLEEVPAEDLTQLNAVGEEFRLENVLVIPSKAHALVKGKQQVSIKDGASVANRYVSVGLQDKDNTWVLQGISEGQSLILD